MLIFSKSHKSPRRWVKDIYHAAEGDSITVGYNATTSYAELTATAMAGDYGSRWNYHRFAISGSTQVDLRSRAASVDAAVVYGRFNIFSVYIGANDLRTDYVGVLGNGSDGWLADLAAYVDARRKAGYYTIVCTPMSMGTYGGSHWNELRAAVSPVIRSWIGVHCDDVCDFMSDPIMGVDSACDDVTLFGDGTHPTNLGHSHLQKSFQPIVQRAVRSL
jgi:lysophospholipase L1-like esterase